MPDSYCRGKPERWLPTESEILYQIVAVGQETVMKAPAMGVFFFPLILEVWGDSPSRGGDVTSWPRNVPSSC